MLKKKIIALVLLSFLGLTQIARAHEVYVLNSDEIARDKALPPLNIFKAAGQNEHTFFIASFLILLLIVCIFGISLSHKIEKYLDPVLLKIKPFASYIAQFTLGCALIASAHYGALYGTELPLVSLFGAYAAMVKIILYIIGVSLVLGVHPRIGAFISVLLFILAIPKVGVYMISYLTYLGEAAIIMLLGGGYGLLRSKFQIRGSIRSVLDKRKYFILRMFFGSALIYAAFYAKLIHGQLALDTVLKYNLSYYFHFAPLFVVLGAFLVETMIGLFFLIGFELRFTSLLFLGFITASLVFFGESVWPHFILIGTALAVFVHGYDEYTIERKWYKKGSVEPVL